MRRTPTAGRRGGVTLIEMIIVIGIIILLAGLLLQVIVKVREKGPQVQTKHDIASLETAIVSFKSTYDVKYFPSAFILTSDYNQPPPNAQAAAALQDSAQFYSKVWPKAFIPGMPGKTPLPPNLPSQPPPPNTTLTYMMDGNQAMVFFLSGIGPNFPNDPNLAAYQPVFHGTGNGFLISPTNPFGYTASPPAPAAGWYSPPTGDKARGFFEFNPARVDANGHYLDPYGYPYIILASKHGNDYNAFGIYSNVIQNYYPTGGYGPAPGVHPFVGLDGKYVNPNGIQIISAGRDNVFGRGSYVDPNTNRPVPFETGIGDYSPGAPGGDDIANFAGGAVLGGNK